MRVIDRNGRAVERDDSELLRDGERMRVPLYLMDSLQRAVAADARRKKVTERDPQGRLRATYEEQEEEPDDRKDSAMMIADDDATYITDHTGARFVLADAMGRTDRYSLARDNGVRRLIPVGKVADDAATTQRALCAQARREYLDELSNAWRGDTAPARAYPFRPEAEGTACTINGTPTYDAAEGARRKQEAYEQMCRDQARAWQQRG
jgi:hypothetical protein